MRLDSLESFFIAKVENFNPNARARWIDFYKVSSSFQIVQLSSEKILDSNFTLNSWVMTYDALRQGLFVAAGTKVRIYKINFGGSNCFGKEIA